jgi:hypothetical protein
MLEELAVEIETLKSSLEDERDRNEKLALKLEVFQNSGSASVHLGVTDVNSNDSSGSSMLELQHKLELILRSNTELVAEKESLLDKLRNQQQYIGKLQVCFHTPLQYIMLSEKWSWKSFCKLSFI